MTHKKAPSKKGPAARRANARKSAHKAGPRISTPQGKPVPELAAPCAEAPQPLGATCAQLPAHRPELLAPAGDMQAALAALAAGADAVYLGLKHFSARMQAENFATGELAGLVSLAHAEGRRVYVAMNTLVKPGEGGQAYRLVKRLAANAHPDALIIQDPALLDIARQAGFGGELHLSTLANVTHPFALQAAARLGASRVIVPRELSFDEVRMMDAACPQGLELEIFVHGALCYCVSGRCWWSSYMGGKSGLRGRCVQPCRRQYAQKGREGRFFSCLDLSLDSAVQSLLTLPNVRSWKIEGRKKGPHYVYYVTSAYRLLRDAAGDPGAHREAARLIRLALGRPGTKALFAGAASPTRQAGGETGGRDAGTSSGLLCGKVYKPGAEDRYAIRPRLDLLPKDLLRIGYEDEAWHCTVPLNAPAAKDAEYLLRLPRGKRPKAGTPVFLIDRREKELTDLLAEWAGDLKKHMEARPAPKDASGQSPRPPAPCPQQAGKIMDIRLLGSLPHGRQGKEGVQAGVIQGLWLSPKALREVSRTLYGRISWWLPPVIWPDEEQAWARLLREALRGGARRFVLNAPWQAAMFEGEAKPHLTAGPFCNLANAHALGVARSMGFDAAIISPELGSEDILALPGMSPLPLGLVVEGFWPVGIARHRPDGIKTQEPFQSPKGEQFWTRRYGENYWFYPAWPMNLTAHRPVLEKAGYTTFVHMEEHPPKTLVREERPGEFNWKVDVL